jgi:hypothetical protein
MPLVAMFAALLKHLGHLAEGPTTSRSVGEKRRRDERDLQERRRKGKYLKR